MSIFTPGKVEQVRWEGSGGGPAEQLQGLTARRPALPPGSWASGRRRELRHVHTCVHPRVRRSGQACAPRPFPGSGSLNSLACAASRLLVTSQASDHACQMLRSRGGLMLGRAGGGGGGCGVGWRRGAQARTRPRVALGARRTQQRGRVPGRAPQPSGGSRLGVGRGRRGNRRCAGGRRRCAAAVAGAGARPQRGRWRRRAAAAAAAAYAAGTAAAAPATAAHSAHASPRHACAAGWLPACERACRGGDCPVL